MITGEDFETWVDSKARKARNILGVGETNMDFAQDYPDLSNWRFKRLTDMGVHTVGIDIVQENAQEAKRQGFDFRSADIEKAATMQDALGDEKFDLILLLDVTEHLSNCGLALENLRERLTPKGQIIISTPTPWYFRDMIRILTGRKAGIYYDHTNFITEEHIRVLAKRHGLKVVASDTVNFNVHTNGLQRFILRTLKSLNNQLMNHYVFVLERRK